MLHSWIGYLFTRYNVMHNFSVRDFNSPPGMWCGDAMHRVGTVLFQILHTMHLMWRRDASRRYCRVSNTCMHVISCGDAMHRVVTIYILLFFCKVLSIQYSLAWQPLFYFLLCGPVLFVYAIFPSVPSQMAKQERGMMKYFVIR